MYKHKKMSFNVHPKIICHPIIIPKCPSHFLFLKKSYFCQQLNYNDLKGKSMFTSKTHPFLTNFF